MMNEKKSKKFWPHLILGGFLFYAFHWLTKLYLLSPNTQSMSDILGLSRFNWMQQHLKDKAWLDVQFTPQSMMMGGIGVFIALWLYIASPRRRNVYRLGEEHGSARHATLEELNTLRDEEPDNNMILSQNARMGLHNYRLPYTSQLNKNVAIIGSSGRGKTRNVFKPNIMQLNSSFMMTDPKGLTVNEVGKLLEDNNYKIKVLDLINFVNSDQFNVFHYMDSELDIDRISESVIEGIRKTNVQGEDFWEQAKSQLMRTLIGYLYFDGLVLGNYEPSLPMVADLLRHINRVNEDVPSPFELMMEQLEKDLPGNYAYKQWQLFQNARGETRASVLYIVSVAFSVFDHEQVRTLISRDTMEIEKWQLEKTAVFISLPETDKSYNFLANLFFTTVLKVAPKVADEILQGKRPGYSRDDVIHLKLRFDEFAQLGIIPNFTESQSSIRSREISADIVVQERSQVVTLYGESKAKTIFNNCATLIYLGTSDDDTMKYLSMRSGDQTIHSRNQSKTYSQQGSSTEGEQSMGRPLYKPDEIAKIPIDETLVFIDTFHVYRDKKFALESHKHYDQLSEGPFDGKWYEYKRYMSDIDEWYANVEGADIKELTQQDLEKVELPWAV